MQKEQQILEEIQHNEDLLDYVKRHLRLEQRKAAVYGKDVPSYLHITIEDLEKERASYEHKIKQLRIELQGLQPQSNQLAQPLEVYLNQIVRQYSLLKLPLLDQYGKFISLPIDYVRIELPLRLTYDHKTLSLSDKVNDVEYIEWMRRETFTSILLIDRRFHTAIDGSQNECIHSLGERLDVAPRIVIVGDPGCGKTTLLASVAYRYALQALPEDQRACFPNNPDTHSTFPERLWVPVVLSCRELLDTHFDSSGGLKNLIEYQLRTQGYAPEDTELLSTALSSKLRAGQAILLVDGLDEIPEEDHRQEFAMLLARHAEVWPNMPILITSRVTGFHAVRQVLSTSFDHLNVAPLGTPEKERFLWSLTNVLCKPDQQSIYQELSSQLCYGRQLARLSESIFLLALITQMRLLGERLPVRRPDIYRRAIELMIERQRKGKGSKLTMNELLPYLEYIAYKMRVAGAQRWSEVQIVAAVEELRTQEHSEAILRLRPAQEWLDAVIHRIGILNSAGPDEIDEYGYERRMIQFFHQSFQEYFAGQALRHRPGIQDGAGVLERLRSKVHAIPITQRRIETLGLGYHSEPVVAGSWQEVVRFCIAELGQQGSAPSADDAIRMILPTSTTSPDEARALTVFALQCLAEEPPVQPDTLHAIVEAIIEVANQYDGLNSKQNTLLDEAFSAVMRSIYGSAIHDQLLQGFIQQNDIRRYDIGRLLASQEETLLTSENFYTEVVSRLANIKHGGIAEQVRAALDLVNMFYIPYATSASANPPRGDYALQKEIVSTLLNAIETESGFNSALSVACAWALLWFTYAKSEKPNEVCSVVLAERPRLIQIIANPRYDELIRTYIAWICSHNIGYVSPFAQHDYIYESAVVADGGKLQSQLPKPIFPPASEDIQYFKQLFEDASSSRIKQNMSIILGRLGIFLPAMLEPLCQCILDDVRIGSERDEALFFLSHIQCPSVIEWLMQQANQIEEPSDTYGVPSRSMLILLYIGDIDSLLNQLQQPREDQMYIDPYAYALVGMADRRGRIELQHLAEHANGKIRQAVQHALDRFMKNP